MNNYNIYLIGFLLAFITGIILTVKAAMIVDEISYLNKYTDIKKCYMINHYIYKTANDKYILYGLFEYKNITGLNILATEKLDKINKLASEFYISGANYYINTNNEYMVFENKKISLMFYLFMYFIAVLFSANFMILLLMQLQKISAMRRLADNTPLIEVRDGNRTYTVADLDPEAMAYQNII